MVGGGSVLGQRGAVGGRGVSRSRGETVAGIFGVQFGHERITVHFGEYRSRRDTNAGQVGFNLGADGPRGAKVVVFAVDDNRIGAYRQGFEGLGWLPTGAPRSYRAGQFLRERPDRKRSCAPRSAPVRL